MPRDANGNYVLPAGNPVTSQSLIEANWANTTMPDLGTEMQDSLSRSGKGSMLAPLKIVDLQASEPGLTFNLEPTSGLQRSAAGDLRLRVLGQDVLTAQQTYAALNNFHVNAARVGVNISSPRGTVHALTASAGGVTPSALANTIVGESDTDMGLSLLAPNTAVSSVYFGNNTSSASGQIKYNHSSSRMDFATNATNAMFIDGTQRLGVGAPPQNDFELRRGSAAAGDLIAAVRNSTTTGSSRFAVGDGTTTTHGTLSWYGTTHASRASQIWLGANTANVPLILATVDTEALRIDPTQKVGIGGVETPLGTLHVRGTAVTGASVHATGNELVIENSASAGITIITPNTNTGSIYFGDPEDNRVGRFQYSHGSNLLEIFTNGAKAMTIDGTGGILAFLLKSGTTQAGAGAAANELWVDTSADNTVKRGV